MTSYSIELVMLKDVVKVQSRLLNYYSKHLNG
jgi:hypothetical protein